MKVLHPKRTHTHTHTHTVTHRQNGATAPTLTGRGSTCKCAVGQKPTAPLLAIRCPRVTAAPSGTAADWRGRGEEDERQVVGSGEVKRFFDMV